MILDGMRKSLLKLRRGKGKFCHSGSLTLLSRVPSRCVFPANHINIIRAFSEKRHRLKVKFSAHDEALEVYVGYALQKILTVLELWDKVACVISCGAKSTVVG